LPGATHPAFSDVFLILPDYINRLVGLRADPLRIIGLTIDTVVKFLGSDMEDPWPHVQRMDSHAMLSKSRSDLGEIVKFQHTDEHLC